MTSRKWKSGDVAMVHITRWPEARTWPDDTSAVLMRMGEQGYMRAVAGDPTAPFAVPPHLVADYVHRLVVLDPKQFSGGSLLPEWLRNQAHEIARDHSGPIIDDLRFLADEIERQAYPVEREEPTDPSTRVTDRRDNTWRLLADGEWVCVCGPDTGEYLTWYGLQDRGPLTVDT